MRFSDLVVSYVQSDPFSVSGETLDPKTCMKFFSIPGTTGDPVDIPTEVAAAFGAQFEAEKACIVSEIAERNQECFEMEMEKLENWANDLKEGLIGDIEKQLKQATSTTELFTIRWSVE